MEIKEKTIYTVNGFDFSTRSGAEHYIRKRRAVPEITSFVESMMYHTDGETEIVDYLLANAETLYPLLKDVVGGE